MLKASQANVKIWLKSYLESDQQLTENILKIKEKDKHISNLQREIDLLKSLIAAKEDEIDKTKAELEEKKQEIDIIKNSKSYKFLQKLKGN